MDFLTASVPCSLLFFTILLAGTFLFTAIRQEIRRRSESTLLPILYTVGFLIGFIYILRYHEFLIIFLAMGLALLCRDYWYALRPRPGKVSYPWETIRTKPALANLLRTIPVVLFVLLFLYETVNSCSMQRR